MTVPKWDDSYQIGLPVFDTEHQLLLGKVDGIFRACEAGERVDAVLVLIDELLDLFLRHIAWEERWMERLTTPAGVEHRNRHKSGHREVAAMAMLMCERLAQGGDCRGALEDLGFFLTLFELIEFDFELVGLLRKEGFLTGANPEMLGEGLPDPARLGDSMDWPYSPNMPTRPAVRSEPKSKPV